MRGAKVFARALGHECSTTCATISILDYTITSKNFFRAAFYKPNYLPNNNRI